MIMTTFLSMTVLCVYVSSSATMCNSINANINGELQSTAKIFPVGGLMVHNKSVKYTFHPSLFEISVNICLNTQHNCKNSL